MEHLLLKAATTATDEGVFEAVISTPTLDRDKDIVEPQAMVNALQKWATIGKLVPLAWAHTEEIVGSVNPSSVRVENGEVIVKGQIDQSTDRGSETWRLVKSGTLSFSFGYLIPKGGATKQPGGRFRIKELDVFEISVVPVGPANNDTRVLSFKDAEVLRSEAEKAAAPDPAALRKESDRIEREMADAQIPELPPASETKAAEERPDELHELKARLATAEATLEDLSRKAAAPDPVALRRESERIERDLAESQIPELPPAPAIPAADEPDVLNELQEVKARLATAETALEDLSKKAEEMDKDRKAPSMDPLRKRSEELALEVASDGMSLRRPPTKEAPAPPDLTDLRELKQQSRDLMDLLLSDTMEN
jgi:HK97 family phage prohead protease